MDLPRCDLSDTDPIFLDPIGVSTGNYTIVVTQKRLR
jgi:hypothetical protein